MFDEFACEKFGWCWIVPSHVFYVVIGFGLFWQLHLHSGSDAPLNITFIRAPSEALLKVDVPLVFIGDDVSPGLRKG